MQLTSLLDFWRDNSVLFDAVLFDIDGTVVYGPAALPGAREMTAMLRRDGTPFYFLTNDGNNSLDRKRRYLNRAGIEAETCDIISCLSVLPDLLRRHDWQDSLFFQVGDLGDTGDTRLTISLAMLDSCRGVIFGEGDYDWRTTWEALMDFFTRHPEAPLVVPNPDTCWPNAATGGIGIGAGGQARCLALLLAETGIRVQPLYLGKPYPAIYDHAVRRLGEPDRQRILCVGDSLTSDIRGANAAGMSSALVLTGITGLDRARAAQAPEHPRYIFTGIA